MFFFTFISADESSIGNDFCSEHPNQSIERFCKTCSCSICVTCSRTNHDGHEMMDIKDYAEITIEELGSSVDSVKSQYTCSVIQKRRKLLVAKRSYANNMKASIAFIKHRAEELKAEIDGICGVIIDEMLEFQNKAQTEFHDLELELEVMEDRLEELEVLYSSMLKTQNEIRILKLGNVLNSRINHIKSKSINTMKTTVEPPVFSIGEYEHETLQDMFGSCGTKDESGMKRSESLPDSSSIGDVIETKMEVLSSFQFAKDDTIRAIVPCEKGKAWVTSYGKKEIQMVKKDGDIHKTLTLDLRINDIATTNDGGLVLTPNGGAGGRQYQIKKMKPNGYIVDFINMKPLLPCSIEVTKDGQIYAGMVDSYNFNVTDSSVRVIARFSAFGVIESKFQYDDKGARLFTQPYTIQENINYDIWIKDRTASAEGRLIVLQNSGKFKFKYTGTMCPKTEAKFNPGDFCVMSDGKVMVTDVNNHLIHLLNMDGVLLQFLNSQDEGGFFAPTALQIDNEGNIWVGNLKGRIQIMQNIIL